MRSGRVVFCTFTVGFKFCVCVCVLQDASIGDGIAEGSDLDEGMGVEEAPPDVDGYGNEESAALVLEIPKQVLPENSAENAPKRSTQAVGASACMVSPLSIAKAKVKVTPKGRGKPRGVAKPDKALAKTKASKKRGPVQPKPKAKAPAKPTPKTKPKARGQVKSLKDDPVWRKMHSVPRLNGYLPIVLLCSIVLNSLSSNCGIDGALVSGVSKLSCSKLGLLDGLQNSQAC